MPEQKQHRALLAVSDKKADSALRGYFRARAETVELVSGADLRAVAATSPPCFALLEISSPGDDRIETLRRDFPELPIVAIVLPEVGTRFEAAQHKVAAVLNLPVADSVMRSRLDSVLKSLPCGCQPGRGSAQEISPSFDPPTLFDSHSSPRMMAIRNVIQKVATTNATVLIRGESGVGKEIAARMIYQLSERREKPFIKVACAAIPHDLLESELFGYEAGAFTGAHRAKPGKFELADGGTIFLDEIAEMHPALQAKLLHVLQDGEFARLGSKRDTSVDVRIICATNQPLEAQVAAGLFRQDLLYRINVVTVNLPPLRERRTEIPGLIQYFLERYSELYQRRISPLDDTAVDAMSRYHWPGNIRELENFCKRYVIMGDIDPLMRELDGHFRDAELGEGRQNGREANSGNDQNLELAPSESQPVRAGPSLLEIGREAAWQAERQAIENMLIATRWNRREAARRLQVSYKALLNKIKHMEQHPEA
jgi:DNA-binding NtrC family response regulator